MSGLIGELGEVLFLINLIIIYCLFLMFSCIKYSDGEKKYLILFFINVIIISIILMWCGI